MNIENKDVILHVVDDDEGVRDSLTLLLKSQGCEVRSYVSAEEFIDGFTNKQPACLILDLYMDGIDGLALQDYLQKQNILVPIIFVTGCGDVPASVQAMKAGAIDFLQKPYSKDTMLRVVEKAIVLAKKNYQSQIDRQDIKERYSFLTKREKQVMLKMVLSNESNSTKSIANALCISTRTVDKHRAKVLQKMQAKTLVDLAEMARYCGVLDSQITA